MCHGVTQSFVRQACVGLPLLLGCVFFGESTCPNNNKQTQSHKSYCPHGATQLNEYLHVLGDAVALGEEGWTDGWSD
jgi:hypothetical protein